MKRLALATLGSLLVYGFSAGQLLAITPTVFSDDFEQDLSKWQPVRDDGSAWTIVDGKARATIDTASTITELVPLDALWQSDWKNLEYDVEITPLLGVDKNISFIFQNLANWYEVHFVDEFVQLARVKNGQIIMALDFPYQMINGMTYRVKIQHYEGRIKILVNNQVIFDHQDWTFDQTFGKIGLKAGTGAAFPTIVEFDNVSVRLLESLEEKLDIPVLKQSDARWADLVYDSAVLWTENPTIKRWGCALTSLVMVMRFHGITQLPDGQELTPATLNTWLVSQPDGYLGEGNLNWLAATRLTKLISDVYGTVKLEYRRHPGADLAIAREEVAAHKPAILQIPNHFVVASGLTTDEQDIFINDPDFNYDRLSQHQKTLISTSTFKPSQTDLSYLLITHQPGLTLQITGPDGNHIQDLQHFTQQLQADGTQGPEMTEPLLYYLVPTPPAGTYQITIKQPQLKPFSFQVITYDQNGQPTIHTQKGIVGAQPKQWQLTLANNTPSKLKRVSSLRGIREQLEYVQRIGGCRIWSIYWLLHQTMRHAEHTAPRHRSAYFKLLKTELKMSRGALSNNAYHHLEQELTDLESSL